MASRADRELVHGLRSSDAATLLVLTQDVLRKPLIRIQTACLCDLLALSELEDLPRSLQRDLGRWRDQMYREIRDLPNGEPLEEFFLELAELPPGVIPACLREQLQVFTGEDVRLTPGPAAALAQLFGHLKGTSPDPVVLPVKRPKVKVERVDTPDSHKAPDERKSASAGTNPSGARVAQPSTPKVPAAQRDQRRDQWIREDLLDRLSNHGANGLKQSLLIAGARHRSPYADLAEDEVVAMLRRLERENRVRHSAGRWSMRGAQY